MFTTLHAMTQLLDRPDTGGHRPARPARYGRVTLHPRRRRTRWAAWLAVGGVLIGIAGAGYRWTTGDPDAHRRYLVTATGWPAAGQAAYRLGNGVDTLSPGQRPVPIASVAKVMTAYVTLAAEPLHEGEDGPRLRVTGADETDTAVRAARDESIVRVRRGEQLTERQALMAVLLPSANNVAIMLARAVAGSLSDFVGRMNSTAAALGMRHTHYTDPSGYDDATVSTAGDQLILAEAVAANRTLTAMVAARSYRLPVAGPVHNTDTVLGHDGFVGTKTGSDDAAGGCFMFRAHRTVGGRPVELIGVVLGQPGDNLVHAGLRAAQQLADRVAPA